MIMTTQQIELLRKRQFWIQLGVSRVAAGVMAGYAALRFGCTNNLIVAINQSKQIEGGTAWRTRHHPPAHVPGA